MCTVLHTGIAVGDAQCMGGCAGQPQPLVNLPEQQHMAVVDDLATINGGLHNSPSDTRKLHSLIGALWQRRPSVVTGG